MGLPGRSIPIIVEPLKLPEPARPIGPDRERVPTPPPLPTHPAKEPVPQQ